MTSTPMEKIKAYHSMKPFISEQDLELVATMLNLEKVDRTKRIEGKDAEFEFLLMCCSLGNLKDVIAFEEGISRLTKTVTTDVLFITKDGRKLAVEIKSTEKPTLKISDTVLNDKENFAKLMSAELYFAIKIRKKWIFLSSNYIRKTQKKVGFKDFSSCELHILGEKNFIFDKPLTFKSLYVTDSNKNIGFEHPHPDYGFLSQYSIEVNKNKILEFTTNSSENLFAYLITLSTLQDFVLNQDKKIEKLNAHETLITETFNKDYQSEYHLNLSDFLVAPIRNITHALHDTYDFTTYIIENIDATQKYFINKNLILNILSKLHKKGFDVLEVINDEAYPLDILYDLTNV